MVLTQDGTDYTALYSASVLSLPIIDLITLISKRHPEV